MAATHEDRNAQLSPGVAIKAPCRAASIAALTLSGEQTVDGVACVTGDRVLVKDQIDQTTNGIYLVSTGSWTREPDFDGNRDVVKGTFVFITNGATNAGAFYECTAANPVVFGSSALTFAQGALGPIVIPISATNVTFTPAGAGAVARSVQDDLRELGVSVKRFGCKGDGVTDDSAAFALAFAWAEAQAFAGIAPSSVPIITGALYVPPGDYIFDGPALSFSTNSAIYFRGAGRQQTRINNVAGVYFVNTDKLIYSAHVSGIHFTGGKGAFRYSAAGVNVQGTHVYEDCYFGNYTECAIGNDGSDFPYWKILRNIFLGTITSKGVSLNGLTDASTIEENSFQYNLIHVQIGTNGTTAMVRNNDFFRNFAYAGTARTDIWLVPGTQNVGLVGTQVINNRLGNENLDATDYRILIADEDTATGTDHITYKPKLSSSTQFASALKIKDNRVGGVAGSRELITSWTVQLSGLEVRNDFYGTPIATLRFGAGVNVPGGTQAALINSFEASQIAGDPTGQLLPEPVTPWAGVFDDPNALYQGYSSVHSYHHSGYDSSFLDLTTTDIGSFSVATGSGASVADATGATLAVEYTATGASFQAFGTFTAATVNRIAFIEFDLKQGSSLPLPTLDFRISNNANLGDVAVRRLISIPAYWRRIRIPFSLPSLAATYNLASFQIVGYSAGIATKFQVARMRIYHAHEPVNLITMGGTLNTNAPVTVTGATYTVLFTDSHIIANKAGTITLTFPSAILNLGREITIRTIQAQTVVSASSNVVPLVGGAAGTAILAATAGKWALAKSDGTNWQLMAGN